MARQFKPVRFFVMIGTAAFIVCGVTAFYTHRAAYGAELRKNGLRMPLVREQASKHRAIQSYRRPRS